MFGRIQLLRVLVWIPLLQRDHIYHLHHFTLIHTKKILTKQMYFQDQDWKTKKKNFQSPASATQAMTVHFCWCFLVQTPPAALLGLRNLLTRLPVTFMFKIKKTQWSTTAGWTCPIDNGPKFAMGQQNRRLKNKFPRWFDLQTEQSLSWKLFSYIVFSLLGF